MAGDLAPDEVGRGPGDAAQFSTVQGMEEQAGQGALVPSSLGVSAGESTADAALIWSCLLSLLLIPVTVVALVVWLPVWAVRMGVRAVTRHRP
ncbi:MAG: hypothetical protein ACYDCQ_16390 [Dehalococcoidia bacterium]